MRHIALFLLPLIAAAAVATAQPVAQPQFLIERIDVRNADRVSPDVVIVESRLRTGRIYSELELREASDRVNRLPYLLSADFSLEKGSDRGKYVLIITLNETRVFFFNLDLRAYYDQQAYNNITYGSDEISTYANDLAVGWRFFAGRRGAVHFGVQGGGDTFDNIAHYSSFDLGYTQYDLFGTRAFVTLNLKRPMQEGVSTIAPQLVVGIPLTPRQTLTTSYDQVDWSVSRRLLVIGQPVDSGPRYQQRTAQRLLKATWSYNTTNHPFVPTNGLLVNVTPLAAWQDGTGVRYEPIEGAPPYPGGGIPVHPVLAVSHGNSLGASGDARRYFEISDRNSLSAGVEGGWIHAHGTVNQESSTADSSYAAVVASASHSLWTRDRTAKEGDNRIEASVRLRSSSYRVDGSPFGLQTNAESRGETSVSWVRRNAWGTWRLGAGYRW